MTCLPFPEAKSNPEVKLFCLPYAGGNSTVFRAWDDIFPDWISVRPIELPGRGARMGSTLAEDPVKLVEQLSRELEEHIQRPWAIFGHSLGAELGYRMIHMIDSQHPLLGFFPSGRRGPTCTNLARFRSHLSNEALIEEVRALNGSPPEVLENQELMAMLLPIIRADFQLSEQISLLPSLGPIHCGMHVFGAINDPEVPVADLECWQDVAKGSFKQQVLPGDHFFLHHPSQRDLMRDAICVLLSNALSFADSDCTIT